MHSGCCVAPGCPIINFGLQMPGGATKLYDMIEKKGKLNSVIKSIRWTWRMWVWPVIPITELLIWTKIGRWGAVTTFNGTKKDYGNSPSLPPSSLSSPPTCLTPPPPPRPSPRPPPLDLLQKYFYAENATQSFNGIAFSALKWQNAVMLEK